MWHCLYVPDFSLVVESQQLSIYTLEYTSYIHIRSLHRLHSLLALLFCLLRRLSQLYTRTERLETPSREHRIDKVNNEIRNQQPLSTLLYLPTPCLAIIRHLPSL